MNQLNNVIMKQLIKAIKSIKAIKNIFIPKVNKPSKIKFPAIETSNRLVIEEKLFQLANKLITDDILKLFPSSESISNKLISNKYYDYEGRLVASIYSNGSKYIVLRDCLGKDFAYVIINNGSLFAEYTVSILNKSIIETNESIEWFENKYIPSLINLSNKQKQTKLHQ